MKGYSKQVYFLNTGQLSRLLNENIKTIVHAIERNGSKLFLPPRTKFPPTLPVMGRITFSLARIQNH